MTNCTAWTLTTCLVSVALVSAQSPPGSNTSAPAGQQAGTVTFTGCLQRTNTGVPAAASNVDAGQTTGGSFVLANARPSSGTAVTSGAPDSSAKNPAPPAAGTATGGSSRAGRSGSIDSAPAANAGSGQPAPDTGKTQR